MYVLRRYLVKIFKHERCRHGSLKRYAMLYTMHRLGH